MSTGSDLISLIASRQNLDDYQKKHWTGSFAEYLDVVRRDSNVTRTAYQRLYDMITSKGTRRSSSTRTRCSGTSSLKIPTTPAKMRFMAWNGR